MYGVQVSVEVLSVLRVEEEVPTAYSGDNIKLRLKGIEEEVSIHITSCLRSVLLNILVALLL